MSDIPLEAFRKKVFQAKRKLIRKADNGGIYENFGQKENRKLEDIAFQIIHDGSRPMTERKEASSIMTEFSVWAENYTG